MSDEKNKKIFRQKAIDRISSPEQLDDYLQVTNPGIWIMLSIIILLLAGLFAWSTMGTIESGISTTATVTGGAVIVTIDRSENVEVGMMIKIEDSEYPISTIWESNFGKDSIYTDGVDLPDGDYEAKIITGKVSPISFLLTA